MVNEFRRRETVQSAETFRQFVAAVQDKDYWEVIQYADEEATRAERDSYRLKKTGNEQSRYADTLKDLIFFIRYGVRPPGVDGTDFQLFQSICGRLARRKQSRSRC